MNPEISGMKFDSHKVRYELIPPASLEEIASVFTYGAQKYDAFNWLRGITFTRLIGACMRHLWEWYRGSDTDHESGFNHLAHASCCILMLLHYQKSSSLFSHLDDRPFKETPNV